MLRAGLIRRGALAPATPPPEALPRVAPVATSPRASEPPLEELIEGRWETLGEQRCYITDQTYPWAHSYGRAPLGSIREIPDEQWQPFVGPDSDLPFVFNRAALLDIETTGLERGAGTWAFLVGIGLPQDAGLRVLQYFMPAYGDEEAQLSLLAAALEASEGLVTFNGRTFDWPILRNRYIMARRPAPAVGNGPHLDLLPLSRRLWRRRLESCALSSLERSVLGMQRTDEDVPGYLIPQLYQDYVELGRRRPMVGVFYHNAMDIVAMAALAGRIGRLLTDPSHVEASTYCDYLSLGRLYERTDRQAEALDAYAAAEGAVADAGEALLVCDSRARLLRRMGRYDEAGRVWQTQLGGDSVQPYIELAKLHEHRYTDYASAQRLVTEALDLLQRRAGRMAPTETTALRSALEHRLQRLERRLANQQRAARRTGPGDG
jgi:hypothetical protein